MEGSPCLRPSSKLRSIRRRRIIPPPESMTDGVGRDRRKNGETGMHRNGGSPFNARDLREKRGGREHRVGQNPDLRVAQVLPVSPVTLVYEEQSTCHGMESVQSLTRKNRPNC